MLIYFLEMKMILMMPVLILLNGVTMELLRLKVEVILIFQMLVVVVAVAAEVVAGVACLAVVLKHLLKVTTCLDMA
jgi:hypothetical protein